MARNIGVELYLVVGEIKLASPNFNPQTLFYCIKKSRCLNLLEHVLLSKHVINLVCYQWWYIWYSLPFVVKGCRQQKCFVAHGLQWQSICFPPIAYASLVSDSSCLHCRSSPINNMVSMNSAINFVNFHL